MSIAQSRVATKSSNYSEDDYVVNVLTMLECGKWDTADPGKMSCLFVVSSYSLLNTVY